MDAIDPVTIARLQSWLRFPDGPVCNDVLTMIWRMNVYERFNGLFSKADPEVVASIGEFQNWIVNCYLDAQLSAIRRQARGGSGGNVQTLRRLIVELRDATAADSADYAQRVADLATLERATRLATTRATTVIAHRIDPNHWDDTARSAEEMTFGEVHESVLAIARLFSAYQSLLLETTTSWDQWIMSRWEWAFTVPWVDEADLE